MSYYSEPDGYIRNKVKVVLDLPNYANQKIEPGTGIDKSINFIALKTEVDKLEINKLINVPANLKIFFKKVDDVDVGKLKAVPVDLKKFSDVVDNEVAKNTKLDTLKTNVNNIEKKTLMRLI